MMMMLNARVQPAKRLKRIVAAISGVERYSRMTIREDCLYLEVMNPNHRVPVSLFLTSAWFDSYNLMSFMGNPGSSTSSWTTLLDLSMFNYLLSLANDHDRVEIHALSDSDFNRFYVLFDHQELGLRCHEMLFWRTVNVDITRLRDMENAYGHGFRVAMSPHHFAHVLRRSMASHSPVEVDITSSMIILSSGQAIRFLEEGLQCGMQNFPEGEFVSLQLSLYMADYFLEAARMAKSIVIKVANPAVTPKLPPSICVAIEKFATLHFFLASNSKVEPQIKHRSCLEE